MVPGATQRGRGPGPGARWGSLGRGQRHMAGRVGGLRLRGPPPPPGSGCQSLFQAQASTGSPAKGRGRRSGAGRGAPGRIRVVSPRGNLRCRPAGGNEGGRRESVAFARLAAAEVDPWRAARRGGRPQQRTKDRATWAPSTPGSPPRRRPGTAGPARAGPVPASPWLREERGRCP